MGRKKYFCDFCCRYFNDDRSTWIKHMSSVAHQKAKIDHYDMFKDPETILKENIGKKPCWKFQKEGYCQFGNSCSYSHYSSYELDLIQMELSKIEAEKNNPLIPPVEEFYQKYNEIMKRKSLPTTKSTLSHELPSNLLSAAYALPLSLQPFDVKMYKNVELNEWG